MVVDLFVNYLSVVFIPSKSLMLLRQVSIVKSSGNLEQQET